MGYLDLRVGVGWIQWNYGLGAGWFDSSSPLLLALSHGTRKPRAPTRDSIDRCRPPPPCRPIPPYSMMALDPDVLHLPSSSALHHPSPVFFLTGSTHSSSCYILGGSRALLGATAAAAASSRRPPFSSAIPAGHAHLRPPMPSVLLPQKGAHLPTSTSTAPRLIQSNSKRGPGQPRAPHMAF
jgi:hypothetical protein